MSSANTEIKEYDVPDHIISLFNEAFEAGLGNCRLIMPVDRVSDKEIWEILIDTFIHNKKNLEYIDSKIFNNTKKLDYH